MNTHTSFHQRLLRTQNAHAAYDIALRTSTGYEPGVDADKKLDRALYEQVALAPYRYMPLHAITYHNMPGTD